MKAKKIRREKGHINDKNALSDINALKEKVEVTELMLRAVEVEEKMRYIQKMEKGIENKRLVGYIG